MVAAPQCILLHLPQALRLAGEVPKITRRTPGDRRIIPIPLGAVPDARFASHMTPMLTFATLGPEGGDHEFALRQYLAAHGVEAAASVSLFDDFHAVSRAMAEAQVDYMLQCALHPLAAEFIRSHPSPMHAVDAFIAPGRPLALVRAHDATANDNRVAVPNDVRRQLASRWTEVAPELNALAVQEGLMAGRYAAGVVRMSFALAHAARWRMLESIDSASTAWIMYGRIRVDRGEPVVWRDSPVALHYWLAADRATPGAGGCTGRGAG